MPPRASMYKMSICLDTLLDPIHANVSQLADLRVIDTQLFVLWSAVSEILTCLETIAPIFNLLFPNYILHRNPDDKFLFIKLSKAQLNFQN